MTLLIIYATITVTGFVVAGVIRLFARGLGRILLGGYPPKEKKR